jgi:hypothetical protein
MSESKNDIFTSYKNADVNLIYDEFMIKFHDNKLLKKHRNFVQENKLGFGEDPFHSLWFEIIKSMPNEFSFLEIGVYKGQILSLIPFLSKELNKKVEFYGVTPLDTSGDKYSVYEPTNYISEISKIFEYFELEFDPEKNIIKGNSTDEKIKNKIRELKFFDLIYIDGCHDYSCVISDLNLMKEVIKKNGIIITDDSSCFKNLKQMNGRFKGHLDVCNAIKDNLENDSSFEEILCVGHNRVFTKIN